MSKFDPIIHKKRNDGMNVAKTGFKIGDELYSCELSYSDEDVAWVELELLASASMAKESEISQKSKTL